VIIGASGFCQEVKKICDMDTTNMTHDVYVVYFFLETRCYGWLEIPQDQ